MKIIKTYILCILVFYATSLITYTNNFFFKDPSKIKKYREVIALTIFRAAKSNNFKELQKNIASKYHEYILANKDIDPDDSTYQQLLLLLIATNNIEIVQKLLHKKVSFTIQNTKGINALSFLIIHSRIFGFDPTQIAKLLIKHGINPTIKDQFGHNALIYAKKLGYKNLFDMFKKHICIKLLTAKALLATYTSPLFANIDK